MSIFRFISSPLPIFLISAWTLSNLGLVLLTSLLQNQFTFRTILGLSPQTLSSSELDIHCITFIYEGKVKSSSLAYNRHEPRPLDRDPDRSWCHLHTSKAFLVAASPRLHGHRRQHPSVLPLSPWIHGLRPRKIYTSVVVTPAPFRVPNQRALVPSFT